MEQVDIRTIDPGDWDMAISLIWRVFLRCNASDYEQEGIESFLNFISDEHLKQFCALGEFECYGAYLGNRLAGVCLMRQIGHISLLFVDTDYHRCGIGSDLVSYVRDVARDKGRVRLTVNATPFGIDFYHKTGFRDTDSWIEKEGIRYIPMELRFTGSGIGETAG